MKRILGLEIFFKIKIGFFLVMLLVLASIQVSYAAMQCSDPDGNIISCDSGGSFFLTAAMYVAGTGILMGAFVMGGGGMIAGQASKLMNFSQFGMGASKAVDKARGTQQNVASSVKNNKAVQGLKRYGDNIAGTSRMNFARGQVDRLEKKEKELAAQGRSAGAFHSLQKGAFGLMSGEPGAISDALANSPEDLARILRGGRDVRELGREVEQTKATAEKAEQLYNENLSKEQTVQGISQFGMANNLSAHQAAEEKLNNLLQSGQKIDLNSHPELAAYRSSLSPQKQADLDTLVQNYNNDLPNIQERLSGYRRARDDARYDAQSALDNKAYAEGERGFLGSLRTSVANALETSGRGSKTRGEKIQLKNKLYQSAKKGDKGTFFKELEDILAEGISNNDIQEVFKMIDEQLLVDNENDPRMLDPHFRHNFMWDGMRQFNPSRRARDVIANRQNQLNTLENVVQAEALLNRTSESQGVEGIGDQLPLLKPSNLGKEIRVGEENDAKTIKYEGADVLDKTTGELGGGARAYRLYQEVAAAISRGEMKISQIQEFLRGGSVEDIFGVWAKGDNLHFHELADLMGITDVDEKEKFVQSGLEYTKLFNKGPEKRSVEETEQYLTLRRRMTSILGESSEFGFEKMNQNEIYDYDLGELRLLLEHSSDIQRQIHLEGLLEEGGLSDSNQELYQQELAEIQQRLGEVGLNSNIDLGKMQVLKAFSGQEQQALSVIDAKTRSGQVGWRDMLQAERQGLMVDLFGEQGEAGGLLTGDDEQRSRAKFEAISQFGKRVYFVPEKIDGGRDQFEHVASGAAQYVDRKRVENRDTRARGDDDKKWLQGRQPQTQQTPPVDDQAQPVTGRVSSDDDVRPRSAGSPTPTPTPTPDWSGPVGDLSRAAEALEHAAIQMSTVINASQGINDDFNQAVGKFRDVVQAGGGDRAELAQALVQISAQASQVKNNASPQVATVVDAVLQGLPMVTSQLVDKNDSASIIEGLGEYFSSLDSSAQAQIVEHHGVEGGALHKVFSMEDGRNGTLKVSLADRVVDSMIGNQQLGVNFIPLIEALGTLDIGGSNIPGKFVDQASNVGNGALDPTQSMQVLAASTGESGRSSGAILQALGESSRASDLGSKLSTAGGSEFSAAFDGAMNRLLGGIGDGSLNENHMRSLAAMSAQNPEAMDITVNVVMNNSNKLGSDVQQHFSGGDMQAAKSYLQSLAPTNP